MPKQTPVPSCEELAATLTTANLYYQTPIEMTLKAINARLTGAEWSLWGYLQALDPHGDRLEDLPPVADLAKTVGISERQCHRALNRLKELDLYYWEPVIIRGQNLAGKRVKEIRREQGKFSGEDKLTKLSSLGQSCHDDDKVVQMKTKLSSLGQSCLEQPPESAPSKDSKTPHTIQTYSDFIKTLSESERENFLKFCEELTSNLSSPVNDIEAWLAHKNKAGRNRWEVYYQKFLVWQQKQTKKYSSNRSSQMKKKFQEEIEQQQQQAIQTWESKHD